MILGKTIMDAILRKVVAFTAASNCDSFCFALSKVIDMMEKKNTLLYPKKETKEMKKDKVAGKVPSFLYIYLSCRQPT